MAGRKNGKKELVQIDADWLLGESMDRPLLRRSWFLRIVLLLGIVVAAVWSWPHVSRQWLQLASAGTTLLSQSSKLHPNTPNDTFRAQKPAIESIPGNQAFTTIRGIDKLPIERTGPTRNEHTAT